MKHAAFAQRGVGAAAALAAALLAACSSGPPAPLMIGQATTLPAAAPYIAPSAPIPAVPPMAQRRPPPLASPPRLAEHRPPRPPATMRQRAGVRIVVRRGQSLGGLAEKYHVPARDIIAANHLPPPYGIEIGQHLLIPGAAGRPTPRLAAAPPPRWVRGASETPPPEIIPLDGPPPRQAPQPIAASAVAPAHEAAPDRGALIWPVRGHVIEGFGVTPAGHHNAGINIAAPQGAPVRAVDGGIVAYAGNQLRGYGNLVLIKHPDGLISAYAHCETLLVHRGERVVRGQVIARVGETGGVDRPQLHFELRQGERALDPLRFLRSLPG